MYLLENETDQKTRFSVYTNSVDSEWFYLCWSLCYPFEEQFSTPIKYERVQSGGGRPQKLTDKLLTNSDQLLISERLYDLIRPYSTCMKAYPSVIYYKGELVAGNYYTIKFEKDFPALNWKLSEYKVLSSTDSTTLCKYSPEHPKTANALWKSGIASKENVGSIYRLVLDRAQLPTKEKIFRLAENNCRLLVTKDLKAILAEEKITGVAFEPVEVTDDSRLPLWTRMKGLFSSE